MTTINVCDKCGKRLSLGYWMREIMTVKRRDTSLCPTCSAEFDVWMNGTKQKKMR
jgi:DNA-directed RNA polymerase subunit RPC12/RpoP